MHAREAVAVLPVSMLRRVAGLLGVGPSVAEIQGALSARLTTRGSSWSTAYSPSLETAQHQDLLATALVFNVDLSSVPSAELVPSIYEAVQQRQNAATPRLPSHDWSHSRAPPAGNVPPLPYHPGLYNLPGNMSDMVPGGVGSTPRALPGVMGTVPVELDFSVPAVNPQLSNGMRSLPSTLGNAPAPIMFHPDSPMMQARIGTPTTNQRMLKEGVGAVPHAGSGSRRQLIAQLNEMYKSGQLTELQYQAHWQQVFRMPVQSLPVPSKGAPSPPLPPPPPPPPFSFSHTHFCSEVSTSCTSDDLSSNPPTLPLPSLLFCMLLFCLVLHDTLFHRLHFHPFSF
eukprot:NODE_1889_length_1367_cov_17.937785_g1710_i0.p1 GENE.NODE_1889_length_1367_cov_17.937785_g1710_i0~~NODE_1889_length_1367_cov_17.937785_g1710_i0.p1  ORF type:complete len:400 (-),score=39.77 NODE_1889_length_1367_cov_17.937785_g1710_i0:167-1189(-)